MYTLSTSWQRAMKFSQIEAWGHTPFSDQSFKNNLMEKKKNPHNVRSIQLAFKAHCAGLLARSTAMCSTRSSFYLKLHFHLFILCLSRVWVCMPQNSCEVRGQLAHVTASLLPRWFCKLQFRSSCLVAAISLYWAISSAQNLLILHYWNPIPLDWQLALFSPSANLC